MTNNNDEFLLLFNKEVDFKYINKNLNKYKKYHFFKKGDNEFELGEHIKFEEENFIGKLLALINKSKIILYSDNHSQLENHYKKNEVLINKLKKSNNEKIETIKNGIQKIAVPKKKKVIENEKEEKKFIAVPKNK